MVWNCYFTSLFPFPWAINCTHVFWCTMFFTHSLPSWFWLNLFIFHWIHYIVYDHILQASSYASEQITASKIIPKFDINPTPSWWIPQTMKGRAFVLKSNPLELGIVRFLWIFVPLWFCCKLISPLAMNLKLSTKVFIKLKTLWYLHSFQLSVLDIIIG